MSEEEETGPTPDHGHVADLGDIPSWYEEIFPAGENDGFYQKMGNHAVAYVERRKHQLVVSFDNINCYSLRFQTTGSIDAMKNTFPDDMPDKDGYFGEYGGSFIPEPLQEIMADITASYLVNKKLKML